MIEGGGLGVLAPEEIGPIDVQARQRRGRRRRRRTKPRPSRWPSSTSPTSRAPLADWAVRRPDARSAALVPENRLRAYDVRRVLETLADTGSVLELRRDFGAGHDHGAGAHRGPAARRSSPTTRSTWRRDRQRRAPTRPRASCSCATPSACRSCSSATRRASWSARRPRRRRSCATPSRMFVDRRQPDACRSSRSCCARATGSARRRWPAAASRRRSSSSPGRPASSAAWASKARCSSAIGKELEAIDDPDGARRAVPGDGRAHLRARQGASTWRRYFEIDDVIDPADSRRWITAALAGYVPRPGGRPCVDPWVTLSRGRPRLVRDELH